MTHQDFADDAQFGSADAAALTDIANTLQQQMGLNLGPLKRQAVLRRLYARLRHAGKASLTEYAALLAVNPGECEELAQQLQMPVAALFRDPRLFSGAFALMSEWSAGGQPRRIWVPACGTGDEVFAFALMSLKAGLSEITVVGTDADARRLATAREAVVSSERIKGVPEVLRPWLIQGGEGDARTRFSPEVMQRCQFLRQDLLEPPPTLGFDLISCRGLLSTLEMPAQRQLLEQMHAALTLQGRLIVSENEEGLMHRDLFVEVDPVESDLPALFRRVERRRDSLPSRQIVTGVSRLDATDSLAALDGAMALARDPMALLNADGVIQIVNPAWQELVSRLEDQSVGHDLLSFVEGCDPLTHLSDWLGPEPGLTIERKLRFRMLRGGRDLTLRLHRNEDQSVMAVADVVDDVDGALAELKRRRKRMAVIGGLLREAVVVVDKDGCIVDFSIAAERMTGWREDEVLGQPIDRILRVTGGAGDHLDWYAAGPLSPDKTSLHHESVSLTSRDGRRLAVKIDASPLALEDAAGAGAVVIIADITVNVLLAEELNYRSTHDALTGLLSREEFERRLSAAISDARSEHRHHAFAYFDLDQFKVINDTLGHFAGDELLRQFAGQLRSLLRSRDVFARLGGDEFGVLMPECEPAEAEQTLREMLEAARRFRFQWDDRQYGLTTSIGLTYISDQTPNAAVALSEADAACFAAKDAGRDRLHVAGTNDETLRRRGEMGMVSRINRALDLDLFELHYEDVVRCRNPGQVVYRELLVRMKDDEHPGQLVSPGLFIPAAERYFMMGALDRWVINNAFAGVSRHPADGVLYAVNVSGLSINDEHFLGFVLECFSRHGVAPEQICFEITETAAISHLKEARNFIERLVNVGCCFALDDFGVGMSSFSYLKNLPVAFLKIDGGFVRSMMQNRVDRGMVEAINRIGHEMNIKTIAEHVENQEVLAALTVMGVDYAQGWAISRGKPFHTLTPSG